MKILLASDLHLTDKPADEYRWGLFPFLRELCEREKVARVFILGDITDSKDRHSSRLVNRVADELLMLADAVPNHDSDNAVTCLMGNHDFIHNGDPFFGFLSHIPRVVFYREPSYQDMMEGWGVGIVPFQREGEDLLDAVRQVGALAERHDLLLMHQTIRGSQLSNGTTITEGTEHDDLREEFARWGKVYSGDIHVPQKVGLLEYIGAPYQIKFGDEYRGRVVLYDLETGHASDEHLKCMRKWTLDVASVAQLRDRLRDVSDGDMVRVRLAISRKDMPKSPEMRSECVALVKDSGAHISSLSVHADEVESADVPAPSHLSTRALFAAFCEARAVPKKFVRYAENLIAELEHETAES